jgi:hypothetical protein
VAYGLAQDHYRPSKTALRPSKRDPFTADIVRMLDKYPYRAAQVWHRLRAQGVAGGDSMVKAHVLRIRPRPKPAFRTLAFAPGECAQVDWGAGGAVAEGPTRRRRSCFGMGLCYSRLLYVEGPVAQTMEHC